jgi:predicted transglutaminase-like cysteine proteinase
MGARVTITISIPAESDVISALLEGLTQVNQVILRKMKSISGENSLYNAGIKYQREPIGSERWQAIDELYKRKAGDCEDLAAALASQYRNAGKDAKAICVRRGRGFHCLTVNPDKKIEDPSKKLGM